MFGRRGAQRVLGLPGNPVSALICARIFLVPLVRALLGETVAATATRKASTTVALGPNGPREHYMRATSTRAGDGTLSVTPVRSQDSSLLSPLALADCLIVRPIDAPVAAAGARVPILPIDF